MNDAWLARWNDRYSKSGYAYGEYPNEYLKEQLTKLSPGAILFPAEGEGRNAVFAAKQGWAVSAFDISAAGERKAIQLAQANQVSIDYRVGELQEMKYVPAQFDAIGLIYAHFPPEIKSAIHQSLSVFLRTGGTIIFEAFSKKHLDYSVKNPDVGGPKDLASLFSIEEIQHDFANYEIVELEEKEIELKEGLYHNGLASVIRFVGKKK
ncbi:MAG: class I SAM-dependent methyltransferase [Bacteroidetes bacterium]|nr:class I SAM-dependent methyltransferase [Bacteroidota bacterium]